MERFKAFKLSETADKKMRTEFVECTLDDLDPGDVVVRVAYSDVNYKDALAATGKGKILRRPSCIGGIDLSGTVVSSANSQFSKGDAVLGVGYELGVSHHGGYAQYARVPAGWLIKLPPGLECPHGDKVECDIDSLAPGETRTLSLETRAAATGRIHTKSGPTGCSAISG